MLLTLNTGTVLIAQRTTSIPSGTDITIRTNETIKTDAAQVATTQVYGGTVSEDVVDSSSRILVPKGSAAQLAVVKESDSSLALDLRSITVNGRRYMVQTADVAAASSKHGGIGANKRTGAFVGGGAVAGTLVGALAGGGKGAAIGITPRGGAFHDRRRPRPAAAAFLEPAEECLEVHAAAGEDCGEDPQ